MSPMRLNLPNEFKRRLFEWIYSVLLVLVRAPSLSSVAPRLVGWGRGWGHCRWPCLCMPPSCCDKLGLRTFGPQPLSAASQNELLRFSQSLCSWHESCWSDFISFEFRSRGASGSTLESTLAPGDPSESVARVGMLCRTLPRRSSSSCTGGLSSEGRSVAHASASFDTDSSK